MVEFIIMKTLVIKMKKRIITSIFILALTLSLPISASQGLSVGDSFTFIVKRGYAKYNYYSEGEFVTGETDKFRVGSTGLSEGQLLDVKVTSIGTSSVNFAIKNNGSTLANPSSTPLGFALNLLLYSLYPFILLGMTTGSVSAINPAVGVSLGDIWYIAPPSIDWQDTFDDFNDTASWSGIAAVYEESEEEIDFTTAARWEDNNETIIFEVGVGGRYLITADNTDFTILHSVEFHYNVSSYVLQGYDIFTWITGTYEGHSTTFSLNAEVAEKSYTRRIGIEPLALILGVILSSGILVVIRKRKK